MPHILTADAILWHIWCICINQTKFFNTILEGINVYMGCRTQIWEQDYKIIRQCFDMNYKKIYQSMGNDVSDNLCYMSCMVIYQAKLYKWDDISEEGNISDTYIWYAG